MYIVDQPAIERASAHPEIETILTEWRDARERGEKPRWPLELPAWAVAVDICECEPWDDCMVTFRGRDWTAGEFTARIEEIYVFYSVSERAKGEVDVYYTNGAGVLVPELDPDQSRQEAEQIAYVIGSAAAELRTIEEASGA
ncbi:hypothetical protein ACFVAJ_11250 [Agromyces sp. NPDC057679]|uniref:hypothetical protein n=1 Tax=Agromyces sp. NPDC057679 TaxID=3346207 RepID=UPI00366F9913